LIDNSNSLLSQYLLLLLVAITASVPLLAFFYLLRDLAHFYFGMVPGTTPVSMLHDILLGFSYPIAIATQSTENVSSTDDLTLGAVSETAKENTSDIGPGSTPQDDYRSTNPDGVERLKKLVLTQDNNKDVPTSPLIAQRDKANCAGRDLIKETASTEVSLVCHVLALRTLVLRYIKAMLALAWTLCFWAVSSKSPSALAKDFETIGPPAIQITMVLSFGFFVWSIITPFVVRFPLPRSKTHLAGMP